MDKKEYIERRLHQLFRFWYLRVCLGGASIFLCLSVLDHVSTPENAGRFLIYRFIIAFVLLAIYLFMKKTQSSRIMYFLGYLGIVSSAIAIELMILHFGGHQSPYYVGMILLIVCVISFIPATFLFHLSASILIYAIYVVPLLFLDEIIDFRVFFTSNFFLIAVLMTSLVLRFFSLNRLMNELGLTYDLEEYNNRLEELVGERTAQLSKNVEELSKEVIVRKQYENALRNAAEEWRTTFDATEDIIVMLNNRYEIMRINRAGKEFFSQSFTELIGKSIFTLLEETGIPRDDFPLEKTLQMKRRGETEIYIPSRDVWLSLSIDPIFEQGDRCDGYVLTSRNITEVKRMQESILQAKIEWEDTFFTINDAITVHDKTFSIVRANKAAEELLGVSPGELSKRKCYTLYHGKNCPPEGCPSCHTLKTGTPSTVELFEPHLNRFLEIKALPRFNQDEHIIGLIHVVKDITDRKKAEMTVQKTSEMMHNILEKSPFGIYVVNKKGLIEYVNPAMLRISGDTYQQFVGTNVYEHPYYKQIGLSENIDSALRGNPFFTGSVEYTSYYAKKTTVRNITGIPYEDEDGEKALVFVEDITERERAETENEKLQSQLLHVQKMESIGRLAGGIAHDFNNILSVIIGYSELALKEIADDQPAKDKIATIHGAGERALALTSQLLVFSRKQVLQMNPVNLKSVTENMAKMLGRLIGEDVTLELKTEKSVGKVLADQSQMEQVLMNLAVNARDAMPGGGRLTIEISEEEIVEEKKLKYEIIKPGSYALLSVRDTGIGMSRKLREKIFEPFFTTKEKGKGTGMGLSTVYGIVKQHNGHIIVTSRLGKGTTFKIYMPLCDEKDETSRRREEARFSSSSLEGTETILVVDDEPSVLQLFMNALQPMGYHALEALNGEEALKISETYEGKIDLLLSDVIMPGMNGRQLAETLRVQRPEIKVILVSGYTDDLIAHKGVLEPGTIFLKKPITPLILSKHVRWVLDSRVQQKGSPICSEELRNLHILLVEDDADNRVLLRYYLDTSHYTVDVAENGSIAVEKYKSGEYDLILMDIQMPVMSGYTATKEIRKWEECSNRKGVPIIALTGYESKDDIDQCINAGCTTHLTKPVKQERLLKTIRSCALEDEKNGSGNGKKQSENTIANSDENLNLNIPQYLLNRHKDIRRIEEALAKKDYETIKIAGHSMKGSGTSYGFQIITEIGSRIEEAAKQNNSEDAKNWTGKLLDYLRSVQVIYK